MVDGLRMTPALAAVLTALLTEPDTPRYGMELITETGLPSGTLYPILRRLTLAGWVAASWEDVDPRDAGRPARRYYTLTPDGAEHARTELHALYRQISGVPGVGRPKTA
ncbi:DNA-binding PadR family transcriptional regulator [Stackebrandtia albiflava]|uniref:DNA-binding PadR family transcriptional regulator n=1 Tax=Stackebrandtia albiflava TaxID=406432 RepID=A0A562VEG7_9ACTN|nr:PadR family transcriptional regulator [Stackebrandtia albiflava]TWJ16270.1 DNA-binding PadR family transcriptional regulator [Stackebrandtia albiflava]